MALFINPKTGKAYKYAGFTPTKSIASYCKVGKHDDLCKGSPQNMLRLTGDFEFAKRVGCLCQCHFTEGKYEETK